WSIAVEEQFYLVFPAVLLLARKASRVNVLMIVAGLFALSFGFSVWAVAYAPTTAFYLLPSRMWELMLGALLALAPLRLPDPSLARAGIGGLGLAMIGIAVIWFHPWQAFPGVAALLPCVGAALVIYAGQQPSFVRSVL